MVLAVGLWSGAAQAFGEQPCCCLCGQQVCVLEVSTGKEDVVRFDVESKDICIPGIRFPWDKCGTRHCGGVRKVCVLKEVSQEKTVCEYDWSVKTICTGCCRKHGLKHHSANASQPQLNQDQRVPFAYYSADAEPAPADPGAQPEAAAKFGAALFSRSSFSNRSSRVEMP